MLLFLGYLFSDKLICCCFYGSYIAYHLVDDKWIKLPTKEVSEEVYQQLINKPTTMLFKPLLSKEMPQLLNSNTSHGTHFDSIKTAIAYLSAPDEVKAQVDESAEPVTEKQINDLKKQYQALGSKMSPKLDLCRYLSSTIQILI